MNDEQVGRLLRNTAALGLARAICGEPVDWPMDAQFRIDDLPVDELPWHGVVVWVGVPLPASGGTMKAPFVVWMADGHPVYVHALLEESADEIVLALVDAMTSPVTGAPRRPRVLCVQNEAAAQVLRSADEAVRLDLAALIDIRVESDPDLAERARAFVQLHAGTQADDAAESGAGRSSPDLPDRASPPHAAPAEKPRSRDRDARGSADDYRLPAGRRQELLTFLRQHARGKDPFVFLRDASDVVVEVTYHRLRGSLAALTEAERNESNMWLVARGIEPMRVAFSPNVAREIGLVANQGTPDWVGGPPEQEAPGWKNTRRYLPADLPPGWTIFASRGDGGLMVETEDESVIVLTCEKRSGLKTLLLTVGHQKDLPVDAVALLRRLRGIGPVREVGKMGPQRLFVARVYGAS